MEASKDLALFLAGFLDEAETCKRLFLESHELGLVLGELGLAGAAMTPVEIGEGLDVTYLDIGRRAFDQPLFDEVVDEARRLRAGPRLRLAADTILAAAPDRLPEAPAGLIFHVGRCGSNLLCNLLSRIPGVVTLREPELFNGLLRRLGDERDPDRQDRLEALAERLLRSLSHGVRRDAARRRRSPIVKLSSWHALFAEALLRRLPTTPAVVMVREPWASVASYLQEPPYWFDVDRTGRAEAARYFAGAWSAITASALKLPAERTLIVSYGELTGDPAGVAGRLCRLFGIEAAPPDPGVFGRVMSAYSKSAGSEPFDPAGRHRRKGLDPELRELVTSITAEGWSALQERIGTGA